MNYLAHYAYNHEFGRLEPRPYFVLGVVLPDLWTRFSRRRRLRWKAVRTNAPRDAHVADLRAGLLNHVEADRRFHAAPIFAQWRAALKRHIAADAVGGLTADFLAHLIPELILDHWICRRSPHLASAFYDRLSLCDTRFVETEISELGQVDARGLAREIDDFIARRYLVRFAQLDTIPEVVEFVLHLTGIPERPPPVLAATLIQVAREIVDPELVWPQMGPPPLNVDRLAQPASADR